MGTPIDVEKRESRKFSQRRRGGRKELSGGEERASERARKRERERERERERARARERERERGYGIVRKDGADSGLIEGCGRERRKVEGGREKFYFREREKEKEG